MPVFMLPLQVCTVKFSFPKMHLSRVPFECKKDYNPYGTETSVSSSAYQLSKAEEIIYSEREMGPQLSVGDS